MAVSPLSPADSCDDGAGVSKGGGHADDEEEAIRR